jgi:dihydroorotate dehydrogenase electron transfer subunit
VRKFSGLCEIRKITSLTDKIFSLAIECPPIAETCRPGQFVQVKIPEYSPTLWPRPFSIHRVNSGTFTVTVKKFGRTTSLLGLKKPGEKLFVTGPLGNSFKLPESSREIYFVAGGVGLPPLHFFCDKLIENGWSPKNIHFYSGAKTVDELFGNDELEASGVDYIAATDDGTLGIRGFVTEPLSVELTRRRTGENPFRPIIYGCGPMAMLKKVAELSYGLDCLVSLEQLMPCGWGVCNGCAVKLKRNSSLATEDNRDYRLARVCKEGPIFDASEVLWE